MSGTINPKEATQSAVRQVEMMESTGENHGEGIWKFIPELCDRYDIELASTTSFYPLASGADQPVYFHPSTWQFCSGQQGDSSFALCSSGFLQSHANSNQYCDQTGELVLQHDIPNIQVQGATGDTEIKIEFHPSSPPPNEVAKHSKSSKKRKRVAIEERREKKRLAARQFRKKQKDHVMRLEGRVMELETQNKELQSQIDALKTSLGLPLHI